MIDLLEHLNPPQQQAVTQTDGPLLVLAGAGSGKTRVIVHRIAYLIHARGVHPRSILAVTFTNKAAGEMKERITKLLGPASQGVWISTFHSFGASLLRREAEQVGLTSSFSIYDDDDQVALAKRILVASGREADAAGARDLLGAVDRKKNGQADDTFGEATQSLIDRYQDGLRAANAVDFGDLLSLPVELFEEHPEVLERYRNRFSHLLVDEFQDTNQVQYRLLKLLRPPPTGNLCVVGDDDQSIYRWRGAEVGNILGFENDYPGAGVIRLTQNYRSDGNILAAAAAVISRNPHRHEKELWTNREAGHRLSVIDAGNEHDEGERIARTLRGLHGTGMPFGEMAVFFRINAQTRVLEEALRVARIPYVIVRGRSFYERAEIKDAIAYLRLAVNPRSDIDLLRALGSPPRGIGDTTVERLTAHAQQRGISLFEAMQDSELAEVPGLNAGTRGRLSAFRELLVHLESIGREGSAAATAQAVLSQSGLQKRLADQGTEEATERLENLMELVGAAREADERFAVASADADTADAGPRSPLLQFLEQVSLIGDADGQTSADRVSIMTLHAAKGLEFDAVVIAGMEEGVFPHSRALGPTADPEELAEERRLAYVGFTRARRRLFLSAARARALFGEMRFNPPSRFLLDVPPELLDQVLSSSGTTERRDGSVIDRSYDQTPSWSGYPRARSSPAGGRPRRPGRSLEDWAASRKVATLTHVESLDWPTGLDVIHPTFGIGKILAADGNGPDAKLTIRFRLGEKRVVARFVKRAG